MLKNVETKIITEKFPDGGDVSEIKMQRTNRIIKFIIIFRNRNRNINPNERTQTTVVYNEDTKDYRIEDTKLVSNETPRDEVKSSEVISSSEGKKVTLVNSFSPEEKTLVNNMVNYIITSHANPPDNIQLENPVDVITVTFCDMQYVLLVYIVKDEVVTLSLKMNLKNTAYTEFIGKRTFPMVEGETLQDIAKKAVEVDPEFDTNKPL